MDHHSLHSDACVSTTVKLNDRIMTVIFMIIIFKQFMCTCQRYTEMWLIALIWCNMYSYMVRNAILRTSCRVVQTVNELWPISSDQFFVTSVICVFYRQNIYQYTCIHMLVYHSIICWRQTTLILIRTKREFWGVSPSQWKSQHLRNTLTHMEHIVESCLDIPVYICITF